MALGTCSRCRLLTELGPRTYCRGCASAAQLEYKARMQNGDPIEWWVLNATSRARGRAKKQGVPFQLTKDSVRELCKEERCFYCGDQLNFRASVTASNCPSLDKVEPRKGYVEGNVVVCCFACNRTKNDADLDRLKSIVAGLERHHGHR